MEGLIGLVLCSLHSELIHQLRQVRLALSEICLLASFHSIRSRREVTCTHTLVSLFPLWLVGSEVEFGLLRDCDLVLPQVARSYGLLLCLYELLLLLSYVLKSVHKSLHGLDVVIVHVLIELGREH